MKGLPEYVGFLGDISPPLFLSGGEAPVTNDLGSEPESEEPVKRTSITLEEMAIEGILKVHTPDNQQH